VTVRVTDQGGLSLDKVFSIAVGNINEAPTNLTLSGSRVAENSPAGAVIGTLGATDPDTGSSFAYALVSDPDAKFQVVGNQLQVRAGANLDYESKTSHQVTLRVTDEGGMSFDKLFTVTVTDVKNERIKGSSSKDLLYSGGGNDTLDGAAGDDVLYSGAGRDVLKGGRGKDVFVFDTKSSGVDTILDFKATDDTIWLPKDVFGTIGKGKLHRDAFFEGRMAHDTADRIIYDKSSGSLYFDPDGVGGLEQIKIAILSHKPQISAADFRIV
jgi:Ca2+-binding RTX toxin-like protein